MNECNETNRKITTTSTQQEDSRKHVFVRNAKTLYQLNWSARRLVCRTNNIFFLRLLVKVSSSISHFSAVQRTNRKPALKSYDIVDNRSSFSIEIAHGVGLCVCVFVCVLSRTHVHSLVTDWNYLRSRKRQKTPWQTLQNWNRCRVRTTLIVWIFIFGHRRIPSRRKNKRNFECSIDKVRL